MEYIKSTGITIIRDCFECNGEPFWTSLVCDAYKKFPQLYVFLSEISKKVFLRRYPTAESFEDRVKEINNFNELEQLFVNDQRSSLKICFVDFIDAFLLSSSPDFVARTLKLLSQSGRIVLCAHNESLSHDEWKRVCFICDSVISLETTDTGLSIVTTKHFQSDGKRKIRVEEFKIDERLKLVCSHYKKNVSTIIPSVMAASDVQYMATSTSFDITRPLNESERKAKKNLKLPFVNVQQEQGLVGLREMKMGKLRAGGQVIYTPDEGDDFDDSDPDDDLAI